MNILVLNLTRFGDLLQSAAAVRALARDGAGRKNKIGVVCLDNFKAGAALLPKVDAVYPLSGSALAESLGQAAETSGAWLRGLSHLRDWVSVTVDDFAPDMVCNLSPTLATPLLGRLLAGPKELRGFGLDARGLFHNTSSWADFIQGASSERNASPFNIVDLFRKTAGDTDAYPDASLTPPPLEALESMRALLRAAAPPETAGFVALQLGASADIRRWPTASFAAVGDALWRRFHLLPVLLGTKSERPLAQEYAEHAANPFHSLVGRTTILELAAALCASSLLVSNDTGTLHLASGLGVPVLGIFLATAQPWDTGPYAPGNCSLEPDLPCHPCGFGAACPNSFACHTAVTPDTVLSLSSAKITAGTWRAANFAASGVTRGARIWESNRDAFGFADLASLSGHEQEPRTMWMRIQRHYYRQFFDRDRRLPFSPETMAPMTLTREKSAALAGACDAVIALCDALLLQGEMLSAQSIPLVQDRFQRTWQRLSSHLRASPDFSAIGFLWHKETCECRDARDTFMLLKQYRELFSSIRNTLA